MKAVIFSLILSSASSLSSLSLFKRFHHATFLRSSTESGADGANMKVDLMATLGGGVNGVVSTSKRTMVNELLLKLEAGNPTGSPSYSPLLNGEWEVVYSGGYSDGLLNMSPTRQLALFLYAGGYSPLNFGVALARSLPESLVAVSGTKLSIRRQQPRVEATGEVKLGPLGSSKVTVTCNLEAESDVRLKETYISLNVAGGGKTDFPEMLQYSRQLFIAYLDEDILVVRDETGVPEVLMRKNKEFSAAPTGEPSSLDDDLAPGAG